MLLLRYFLFWLSRTLTPVQKQNIDFRTSAIFFPLRADSCADGAQETVGMPGRVFASVGTVFVSNECSVNETWETVSEALVMAQWQTWTADTAMARFVKTYFQSSDSSAQIAFYKPYIMHHGFLKEKFLQEKFARTEWAYLWLTLNSASTTSNLLESSTSWVRISSEQIKMLSKWDQVRWTSIQVKMTVSATFNLFCQLRTCSMKYSTYLLCRRVCNWT